MQEDIRWIQRFQNYEKAYLLLGRFIEKGDLSEFEKQGLIKSFEYTYELAWNVMKDYLIYQGISGIMGSRDAIKQAFNKGLIKDGQLWINMIQDRIKTVHTYDEEAAEQVEHQIISVYFDLFSDFYQTMKNLQ